MLPVTRGSGCPELVEGQSLPSSQRSHYVRCSACSAASAVNVVMGERNSRGVRWGEGIERRRELLSGDLPGRTQPTGRLVVVFHEHRVSNERLPGVRGVLNTLRDSRRPRLERRHVQGGQQPIHTRGIWVAVLRTDQLASAVAAHKVRKIDRILVS